MPDTIFPCLWFDGNAKEAATFYCSIFSNSTITTDTTMVVKFEIEGKTIMGLNGGPTFKINPSISLFVTCQTDKEIENTWNKLLEGGTAMMPLDKYPWSEKYGWVMDKFGMTWQLMLGEIPANGQKIVASFLFTGEQYSKAQQAMQHYTSIFPNAAIEDTQIYQAGEAQPEGSLKFGRFKLQQQTFTAMDGLGEHQFKFNEAVSIVVECETQKEVDDYWHKLTEGGEESRCGWLTDKFGVSWQIIPKVLGSLMTDPEKAPKVMQAIMQMKKIDIATLINT